ncbi:MAG TPA: class I tRNA ligase family protein [Candidatus Moranbacteria bacterium]|nr:class I tRNA ligase family protein [Candidatus Moranbacteria bacterium]
MFKKVDPKVSLPKMEEEILKFWEENKIFEKSVEKNPEEKSFIFYEGPPTANGQPGLHHVLARAFKDVIPRYKTMKGYRVERKAGWDTHGLPVELQVEKALGLKNKQDIENIVQGNMRESIIEFNRKCKESVWEYKDLWEKMTRRMAYWVDMKSPYVTYENKYIESVWWVIAQIWKTKNKKGESLIYKGHKVVPYCYRCGTALSSHEVAQGYQKIKDNSVYVKFKLKDGQKIDDFEVDGNAYILAWTTTPWTLPGNVALAINKDIDYVILKRSRGKISGSYSVNNEIKEENIIESGYYILSKDIFWKNMQGAAGFQEVRYLIDGYFNSKNFDDLLLSVEDFVKKYNIKIITGEKLLNLNYEPLYNLTDNKKAYKIISGDFVTTEDGTGIVHIAPAFGEDDANAGRENDLPTLLTVNDKGEIDADVPGKGIPVKKRNDKNRFEVDDLIIEDLKKRNLFFKEKVYEHEYPFCWRCDTPLIYYAKPSWFIRMSELSDKLVKNNEPINWVPEHIKEGRFGEWLRGVKDWAISRERYWGTPLPIWECECGETKIIESIKELKKISGQKIDDVHKPYIDDIKFKCSCGKEMRRVSEVMDVWFDSGSMPLAQWHYPNDVSEEIKEKIESGKYYPADFICEAIDQTRGWFYTLHAISSLLSIDKKVPSGNCFKNVICLGHILDAKGKKMSKSKGNIVEPMKIMDEYGADMLRWMLYTINQPGLPKRFDVKGMKDIMNRVFRMLWNSYYFFVMYSNIDKFVPSEKKAESKNLLDKWIISELQMLIKTIDEKLEKYDVYGAAKPVESFVDNLSNWYIRRSRKRFWKSENDTDKNEAYETLHYVLVIISKLMAPFTPFIADEIYRNLVNPSPVPSGHPLPQAGEEDIVSVHLSDFPVADEKLIDEKLNEEMAAVRNIISQGLATRAEYKLKVRQPLTEAYIYTKIKFEKEFISIICEELNIKGIRITNNKEQFDNELVANFIDKNKRKLGLLSDDQRKFPYDEKYGLIALDIEITEDLKLEGIAREIIRSIQEMRKEAGYEVDNRIEIGYDGWSSVFQKFGDLIAKETLANSLTNKKINSPDLSRKFAIEDQDILLEIKK